jgi:hypothetical protein
MSKYRSAIMLPKPSAVTVALRPMSAQTAPGMSPRQLGHVGPDESLALIAHHWWMQPLQKAWPHGRPKVSVDAAVWAAGKSLRQMLQDSERAAAWGGRSGIMIAAEPA